MKEIMISEDEYKDLIRAKVRVEVFAEYVKAENYSISREVCARFLGFELEKDNDRESNAD